MQYKLDLFKLHDTYGIPIQFIAEELDHHDMSFNWLYWMRSAVEAGWSYDKIKSTIFEINDNLYGTKWRDYQHLVPIMYIVWVKKLCNIS